MNINTKKTDRQRGGVKKECTFMLQGNHHDSACGQDLQASTSILRLPFKQIQLHQSTIKKYTHSRIYIYIRTHKCLREDNEQEFGYSCDIGEGVTGRF